MMADWEIKKTLGQCYGTGRELEVDEEYFATLVETPEGFERRDFCVEYWESQNPEVYCFWKTRIPNPDTKKQIFIDNEMLLAFFDRLAGESETEKVNFRFVLMLVLMRTMIRTMIRMMVRTRMSTELVLVAKMIGTRMKTKMLLRGLMTNSMIRTMNPTVNPIAQVPMVKTTSHGSRTVIHPRQKLRCVILLSRCSKTPLPLVNIQLISQVRARPILLCSRSVTGWLRVRVWIKGRVL